MSVEPIESQTLHKNNVSFVVLSSTVAVLSYWCNFCYEHVAIRLRESFSTVTFSNFDCVVYPHLECMISHAFGLYQYAVDM